MRMSVVGITDSMAELLCRVDFPLYGLTVLSPKHLLVGGGGGAAKTGVKNGFEIFALSHDGRRTVAESMNRYDTDSSAVMNLASARYDPNSLSVVLAVGQNENTQLYKLQMARDKSQDAVNGGISSQGYNNDGISRKVIFHVKPMKSIQTDFNMPEPYQKVVRLSPNNKYMATGGDDGILRVWTFPDLYRTHEIEAHDKEIDDLDFSPDSTKIVSISKDRRAFVWDVKKGKKHAELGWDPPSGVKYMFKRVRFGRVEGDAKRSKVYSIVNPVGASKPPSYLQRWDSKSFQIEQKVDFPECSLSALAVSDNGNFVATGSMFDGTVEIFIAFTLQRLKRVPKSHSTFITGLEFLPCSEDADVVRGFSDASVVSISVDHQICIHHVPRLKQCSMMMATLIIAAFLIMAFILCSYLGL